MTVLQIAPATEFDRAAIAACLDATARRDPLVIPVDLTTVLSADAFAARIDGEIVGVAWSRHDGGGLVVEARVHPQFRRQGIGSALLARLTDRGQVVLTSCDFAHPRARRFIERRGFDLVGVVFFQRWDGERCDVPGAFRSCTLAPPEGDDDVIDLLERAHRGAWPPPVVRAHDLATVDLYIRVARVDGEPVGALVAAADADVYSVCGFGVLAAHRRRGIGRALLCELMERAAEDGVGVALRVDSADAYQQAWTAELGYWTYRSWAYYRRAALVDRGASA